MLNSLQEQWSGDAQGVLAKTAGIMIVVLCALAIIITPLGLRAQLMFGVLTFGIAAVASTNASRRTTLMLTLLSVAITLRYIYWRFTQTLSFDSPLGGFLGIGLFLAELYASLIMILSYVQTAWPLDRKPIPLPSDVSQWPTVDVYIPTYNESLAVVGDTVIAALNMDYPADKMRVYLLDDGRREEFRAFAEEIGCHYITRPDNKHAKAGNLNHAMTLTDGEYVCIFDCDHVPTRAFLQLTMGTLVADPTLALVQTPHHFYSQEPFQRNTAIGRNLPSEGELFYGRIQPGNDFWNAAYFCGSCAVIRRKALDQVGRFAGETVTEDAHSALKMQKLGWNTAYLNIPLAAGLATEKFALHVGQRVRWARGMTQIFRLDNPLFGGKMKLPQRLCYLNAIMHFQFPLARLVFLTSPLAYLFLGQSIIAASASLIAAYALPHLFHSWLTNARLEDKYRHAFWGEIYEVALTFHLLRPTLSTLLRPRHGKFNVTDKGGLLNRSYFDWHLVSPHLFVSFLLIGGIAFGLARVYLWPDFFPIDRDTMWLNTGWSIFNLVILFAAISVALESKQIRKHVRFPAKINVTVRLRNERQFPARTVDISMGGVAIRIPDGANPDDLIVGIVLPCGSRLVEFPVRAVNSRPGVAMLQFAPVSLSQRRDLVLAIMGRADAWISRPDLPREGMLKSWLDLLKVDGSFIMSVLRWRGVRKPALETARVGLGVAGKAGELGKRAATILVAFGLGLGALLASTSAHAQGDDLDEAQSFDAPLSAPSDGAERNFALTLKDLGAHERIVLSAPGDETGLPFTLRHDEIASQAVLSVTLSYAGREAAKRGSLAITLNGEPLGEIRPGNGTAQTATLEIPINPILLLANNTIGFRYAGKEEKCVGHADPNRAIFIDNMRSSLRLTVARLPEKPSLARLPAPFFDEGDMMALDLPFVYANEPNNSSLLASAVVASYFGGLASYRGYNFTPNIGTIPDGNAVVFATGGDTIPGLRLPVVNGPTLAVVQNPGDPQGWLLLVLGRDGAELRAAANALALGHYAGDQAMARVEAPALVRHADNDAPRWLRVGGKVQLAQMPNAALNLDAKGMRQGVLTADFRIPPDLYAWPDRGMPLSINYRYPVGNWLNASKSHLDVLVNNQYLKSFPLRKPRFSLSSLFGSGAAAHRDYVEASSKVDIPTYLLFGQNQLQFYFNLVDKAGACGGPASSNSNNASASGPGDISTSIGPDTTLDLTNAHHFAKLPNLAFFASAGFPFTRAADLSRTVAVMSQTPDLQTIAAFLNLMGRFGDATGVPATGLALSHGDNLKLLKGKDVLVLGSDTDLSSFAQVMAGAPVRSGDGALVVNPTPLKKLADSLFPTGYVRDLREADRLLRSPEGYSALMSFRSPVDPHRLVVALVAKQPFVLPALVRDLNVRSRNAKVQGDLTLWTSEGIESFAFGPQFWAGDLPPLTYLLTILSRAPLFMALGLVVCMILLSLPLYSFLRVRAHQRLEARS